VRRRDVVPYTCHDILSERGAKIRQAGIFQSFVAVAGNLITGQNPASAKPTAEAVVSALSGAANLSASAAGALFSKHKAGEMSSTAAREGRIYDR
jgi:hypothetical protein